MHLAATSVSMWNSDALWGLQFLPYNVLPSVNHQHIMHCVIEQGCLASYKIQYPMDLSGCEPIISQPWYIEITISFDSTGESIIAPNGP